MEQNSKWIRTCQECGHKQTAKQPAYGEPISDSYANSKCRRCKSEALDYGYEEIQSTNDKNIQGELE